MRCTLIVGLLVWGFLVQGAQLEFRTAVSAAGACVQTTEEGAFCRVPAGTQVQISLWAAVRPAQALQIAAAQLPAGLPPFKTVLAWGSAQGEYTFTAPSTWIGQTLRLSFQAWSQGASPAWVHVAVEVVSSPVACPTPAAKAGSWPALDLVEWRADRPLSWSDFRGPPPADARQQRQGAMIYMLLGYRLEASAEFDPGRGQWVARPTRVEVTNAMDPTLSWVLPDQRTPAVLNHEQRHFDLQEVYRRRLEQRLWGLWAVGPSADQAQRQLLAQAAAVFEQIQQENAQAQQRYDRETDHGRLTEQQALWDQRIALWLANPALAMGSTP